MKGAIFERTGLRYRVSGRRATCHESHLRTLSDRGKKVKFVHRRRSAKQSFWFRKRSREVHYKQAVRRRQQLYLIWGNSRKALEKQVLVLEATYPHCIGWEDMESIGNFCTIDS